MDARTNPDHSLRRRQTASIASVVHRMKMLATVAAVIAGFSIEPPIPRVLPKANGPWPRKNTLVI